MARLVGILANRADLPGRLAALEHRRGDPSPFVVRRAAAQAWGYGIGFLQSGELLLARRPIADQRQLDLATMWGDVRSDLVVTEVRETSLGQLTADDTPPFRYGDWLFADTGRAPAATALRPRLLADLPDFLRRAVRGETVSEVVFHHLLAALHRVGELDARSRRAHVVAAAIDEALERVARASAEEIGAGQGLGVIARNVLVASPEGFVVAHQGAPMAYRVLCGREALAPLFSDEGPARLRMPDLDSCRLVVVASDFDGDPPAEWTRVPAGARMSFLRNDVPAIL